MKTESQRIGHYELQHCLRQDPIGETWRAYDSSAKRTVILKLYRTDESAVADTLTSYLDDVEQIAALHHPNIARIYDIQLISPKQSGGTSALICVAVEYIEGETLADFIKQTTGAGKMPVSSEVVQLFTALALALDGAHQRGIVHGNLKPTNILLAQTSGGSKRMGTPLITDFGQTKFTGKKQSNDLPFYLAPEQIKGASAGGRCDIYALGVLLYELYTSTPPFRGNRPIAVMMQHVNALPTSPDLVNPGISPALARVILRCLDKDPQARFSTVTALAVELASALHVPVPESLRHFAHLQGQVLPETHPSGMVKDADLSAPPGLSQSDLAILHSRRRQARSLIIISIIALICLVGAGFGAMQFMRGKAAMSASAGAGVATGNAFFLSSGQINETTTQGINDELEVDLSNLSAPAPGKSYYAWLLGDRSQTEVTPLLLGRLTIVQGNVHLLYTGDSRHTNLLTFASRFLINEDDARRPSSDPLLDQRSWRYYATIPQTADPADKMHFSMLDHLRHLLVESPELAVRGLHGGLAYWFARDTSAVAKAADGLDRAWQQKDAATIHEQVVRVLDYLDGSSFIQPDVPAGTPFLADAQIANIALLGPESHETYAPGFVYQNEPPPGYVYLVQTHLNGALLSPQATANQHQLALQINGGIDSARRALTQLYQDARQLVKMNTAQLLQASTLTLLNDLVTQAQYAFTGQPNPSTGTAQSGALWIYNNLQRLATFNLAPYPAPHK
ncbi:MAG TPA: serine/threonine-protein kinase [Ktedonobacteraceae bacterium]